MIKRIPVLKGSTNVHSFKVESFPANRPKEAEPFGFVQQGIVRVVALAGDKILDSDVDTESIWFDEDEVFIRFGTLMLPPSNQYLVTLKVYQLGIDSPTVISAAYSHTQIVLVTF